MDEKTRQGFDSGIVDRDEPEADDTEVSEVRGELASATAFRPPPLAGVGKKRGLVKKPAKPGSKLTAEARLLILDTWQRSALPAKDFAPLVGVTKHTLYAWKKKFDAYGPAGLMSQPRGRRHGSRLPELTRRTIVMLKQANPQYGCQRISDMLARGPALPASASAVARVLREAGYELVDEPTRPHPDKVRRFERAAANQMWQTDLFTFVLKRQNRRVHLVGFLDDHSRFVVGYGLHATQSTALVLEALRASIANYGAPAEILTDNGSQYVTWRGKSAFSKELEQRGIKQVVARPRRPQTLGKIERFWGTLWRECVDAAVFVDLDDARRRIGHFIDHYNFHRTHQGIDGLVPADRFFGTASEVRKTIEARVAKHALELARHGAPKRPFYLTGRAGGEAFSIHAQGERVVLTREGKQREELDLGASPASPSPVPEPAAADGSPDSPLAHEPERAPGASPLDAGLAALAALREGDDA